MTAGYSFPSKRFAEVGESRIAYRDEGTGPDVLLLHGCPFSSYIWRNVITRLSGNYRCLAPDLLGLGDTETAKDANWSLRAQAMMIIGFLDALKIDHIHVIGHDHGGAVAQLLAAEHPERVDRMVLSNVEAYDNWPSAEERPFAQLAQVPLLGDALLWLWSLKPILRATLIKASAVYNPQVLTSELLDGYVRANFSDRHRRRQTKRFLAVQFDPSNNRVTTELLDGLRRFDHPTLLLWGQNDPHFGVEWGERLYKDIPGATRLQVVPAAGHLLMEDQPEEFSGAVRDFLADTADSADEVQSSELRSS